MLVAVYVRNGRVETAEWADRQTSVVANWALDAGLLDGADVDLMEVLENGHGETSGMRVLRYLLTSADFDEVWVVRLDRLGANARVVGEMLELARVHGKRVRSVTENFDSGTPAGRQVVETLAMFAEQQSASLLAALEAPRPNEA